MIPYIQEVDSDEAKKTASRTGSNTSGEIESSIKTPKMRIKKTKIELNRNKERLNSNVGNLLLR